MPARGKWSASTTMAGTCAFPALPQSSRPRSPPLPPPRQTPAIQATSPRETAVWVGVWFVTARGVGGGQVATGWMITGHVCLCACDCVNLLSVASLWGTGGHGRCWEWRQHAGAICVGVSAYESMGGQTDSGGILEGFTREQLPRFKSWTLAARKT